MKSESESTELPYCVISHIFSKLSLKNLVKTSALSKHWYHEWGSRKDLTFDLHNMFDYDTTPELPITLPLFQHLQSQFATRLDYFMQKYPGDMISSIRLNFPLGVDHTYAIDRLIHKGLVKGANRIELLFANETDFKIWQYNFLFPFMFGPNSLTYLHLQNCRITPTMDFSGLKNLTTLVLHLVPVEQNMLQDLCFSCIHLENFTLNECLFLSDLKITSTTLLHLNMNCGCIDTDPRNIDIIASNLLSIEYSIGFLSCPLHKLTINSPMLSNFTYGCAKISNVVEFSMLKNVKTIVLDELREGDLITHLFSKCLQLEHVTLNKCRFTCDLKIISAKLRHLGLICCYHTNGHSCKMDIHALNLSSFEYRGYKQMRSIISVEAPKLLKIFWDAGFNKINVYNYATIARLHHPENFATHTSLSQVENLPLAMHTSLSQVENLPMHMSLLQISKLMKDLVQSQNLRQLELFIAGAYNPNMDYFWILDIAMASPHLQKLSLTIKNEETGRLPYE